MCVINGRRSFMKNTHSITSGGGIEKLQKLVLYCGARECQGDINQPQWESARQTWSFWTIFHIVVIAASVVVSQQKFSSWPEIYFESTRLSTILCRSALLWLVCSKAATVPDSCLCSDSTLTLRWCFSGVWDIILNALHLSEFGGGLLLFCSRNDFRARKPAHMFISRARV